jgi:hypothetical protein
MHFLHVRSHRISDYIVKNGGLNISLLYPMYALPLSPHVPKLTLTRPSSNHRLRRKYVPFPFPTPGLEHLRANETFTPSEVEALLAQPTGNFIAFQYYMEKASLHRQ